VRRSRLAFAGVLLAAAMAGAAVTVAYGLATGFDRAARQADLPDVIVRFRGESRAEIDRIVAALPNVADRAYRLELNGVGLSSQGGSSELLSRGQQRRIDEHFQAELARLGSDFPYEDFCEPTTGT